MKWIRLVVVAAVLAGLGTLLWQSQSPHPASTERQPPVQLRGPGNPLTIALTGDTLTGPTFTDGRSDAGLAGVSAVLHQASLAVTDLDQRLVDDEGLASGTAGRGGWPAGTAALARDLRRLGFSVVTLANGHAADDGPDGVERARRLLTEAGLWHAGAGSDQAAARQAVVIGEAPRRVAVLGVATSALPSARATPRRGEVAGRAGVSALRYHAVVTADPRTFDALTQMSQMTGNSAAAPGSANELTMSGTTIRKGAKTSVDLVADTEDLTDILAEIRRARANADVVVVSLHSHEPGNRSQTPASFLRDFAHQAIEAGASVVVGHGPRQLRGIETYRGGAILYSLGSFAFRKTALTSAAANMFDTDVSVYDVVLGAVQDPESLALPTFAEPIWWESVIATATFTAGGLTSIALTPIDLRGELADAERGLPRLAAADSGRAILQRLDRLSSDLGTRIEMQGDQGVVTIPSGRAQEPPARSHRAMQF